MTRRAPAAAAMDRDVRAAIAAAQSLDARRSIRCCPLCGHASSWETCLGADGNEHEEVLTTLRPTDIGRPGCSP